MKANIYIMPKEGILDPEGEVVARALRYLGSNEVSSVRIGKFVEMDMPGLDHASAEKIVHIACDRMLVNPNIESYTFDLVEGE